MNFFFFPVSSFLLHGNFFVCSYANHLLSFSFLVPCLLFVLLLSWCRCRCIWGVRFFLLWILRKKILRKEIDNKATLLVVWGQIGIWVLSGNMGWKGECVREWTDDDFALSHKGFNRRVSVEIELLNKMHKKSTVVVW